MAVLWSTIQAEGYMLLIEYYAVLTITTALYSVQHYKFPLASGAALMPR